MNQALQAVQISLTGITSTFAVLGLLHILLTVMARISSRKPGDLAGETISEPEEIAAIIAALSASGAGPSTGGQIHIEKVSG
jgi:Na+-transporting methylmalonyl-CoA/oxaloacetate decarboxylase gamma subunit